MKNLLLILTMICFVNTNIRADNNPDIKELIRQLGSEDWQRRANAQQELTEQGKNIVFRLCISLKVEPFINSPNISATPSLKPAKNTATSNLTRKI